MCQRHYQRQHYHNRKREAPPVVTEVVPPAVPPYVEKLRWFLQVYGVTEDTFAAKIRICEFHRSRPGMTNRELAEILGFHYQTVGEWAKTDYGAFPSARSLQKIHAALDAYEQSHQP